MMCYYPRPLARRRMSTGLRLDFERRRRGDFDVTRRSRERSSAALNSQSFRKQAEGIRNDLHPSLGCRRRHGRPRVQARVAEVVDRAQGKLVKVEAWGTPRKLAYPVSKQRRGGVYVYVKFVGAGGLVAEFLERNLEAARRRVWIFPDRRDARSSRRRAARRSIPKK